MENGTEAALRVEVVYATAREQVVVALTVPPGLRVRDVVGQSGVLERFPELQLLRTPVGIFGRLADWDDPVHDGDRIELYRPLLIDPKEARRVRARAGSGAPR